MTESPARGTGLLIEVGASVYKGLTEQFGWWRPQAGRAAARIRGRGQG